MCCCVVLWVSGDGGWWWWSEGLWPCTCTSLRCVTLSSLLSLFFSLSLFTLSSLLFSSLLFSSLLFMYMCRCMCFLSLHNYVDVILSSYTHFDVSFYVYQHVSTCKTRRWWRHLAILTCKPFNLLRQRERKNRSNHLKACSLGVSRKIAGSDQLYLVTRMIKGIESCCSRPSLKHSKATHTHHTHTTTANTNISTTQHTTHNTQHTTQRPQRERSEERSEER